MLSGWMMTSLGGHYSFIHLNADTIIFAFHIEVTQLPLCSHFEPGCWWIKCYRHVCFGASSNGSVHYDGCFFCLFWKQADHCDVSGKQRGVVIRYFKSCNHFADLMLTKHVPCLSQLEMKAETPFWWNSFVYSSLYLTNS